MDFIYIYPAVCLSHKDSRQTDGKNYVSNNQEVKPLKINVSQTGGGGPCRSLKECLFLLYSIISLTKHPDTDGNLPVCNLSALASLLKNFASGMYFLKRAGLHLAYSQKVLKQNWQR